MPSNNSRQDINMDVYIEQYKLYVEITDKTSDRRAEANKFYTSILTGLLAVISIVIEKNIATTVQSIILLAISLLGIILCIVWAINIRSYKQLNSLRFDVIQEMEKRLPFPSYTREWEILKNPKNRKGYLRLTQIEQFVPLLISIPYLILLLFVILG